MREVCKLHHRVEGEIEHKLPVVSVVAVMVPVSTRFATVSVSVNAEEHQNCLPPLPVIAALLWFCFIYCQTFFKLENFKAGEI